MTALKLRVSNIRILRTGADGGHLYLRGECDYEGVPKLDTYAYFPTRTEEKEFESDWSGEDLLISSSNWEHDHGVCIHLRDISYGKIEPGA